MMIRRRAFLSLPAVLLPSDLERRRAIRRSSNMRRSDPASVGRTGRPQLVEFFLAASPPGAAQNGALQYQMTRLPAVIIATPSSTCQFMGSCSHTAASTMVSGRLSLSMGATHDAGAACSARK